jgi:5-methylcytosine-specific restriction enzyme subunit McrC
MHHKITEHSKTLLYPRADTPPSDRENLSLADNYKKIVPRLFPSKRGKPIPCYNLTSERNEIFIEGGYFIGVDWINEEESVSVLPKMNINVLETFARNIDGDSDDSGMDHFSNIETKELNYIKMLSDAIRHPVVAQHIEGLILIDWKAEEIEIEQKDDALTPFLIVQFLSLLKKIVKKGLRKSYYQTSENLRGRIKGKILIDRHIRSNVLKNKFSTTSCSYQDYGTDSSENRFLKKVLTFVRCYIESNPIFQENRGVRQLIAFCLPAFERVTENLSERELKSVKMNPFFREYQDAFRIGHYILKRFGYNITNTVLQKIKTPPFWIDMPRLFELYTYNYLLSVFADEDIHYHFSTLGNELDFLISAAEDEFMVVDAKYKLRYKSGQVHSDIRQVSGYARLNSVYKELGRDQSEKLIPCLIMFPTTQEIPSNYDFSAEFKKLQPVKAYRKVFKLGIPMPYIG